MLNLPTIRLPRALVLTGLITLLHPALILSRTLAQVPNTVTDLGNIATNGVSPAAINRTGQVAGYQSSASGTNAVVWSNDVSTALPMPPGEQTAFAYAINDAGVVCGQAGEAVRWAQNAQGVWSAVGISGPHGSAYGIDAIGDIVGSAVGVGSHYAIEWPVSGPPYLPYGNQSGLNANISELRAINSPGHMMGWVIPNGNPPSLGFFDNGSGTPITFTIPNMSRCLPRSMNDYDQIVGEVSSSGGTTSAFVWQNKQASPLPLPKGWTGSSAYAINNQGIIVGWASDSKGNRHAVKWILDATKNFAQYKLVDLNGVVAAVGWNFTTGAVATGINALGQIVGLATLNKAAHGFLLTPALHGIDMSSGSGIPTAEYCSDMPDGLLLAAGKTTVNHVYDANYVIVQAWGGLSQNSNAQSQIQSAVNVTLPVAAYCFLDFRYVDSHGNAIMDGDAQAAQALQAVGAIYQSSLKFMAVDVEIGGSIPKVSALAHWNLPPGLQKSPLNATDQANAVTRIKKALNYLLGQGVMPVIYTDKGSWDWITANDPTFAAYSYAGSTVPIPLWEAKTVSDDSLSLPDVTQEADPNRLLYKKGLGGWKVRGGKQYLLSPTPGKLHVILTDTVIPQGIEVDCNVFDPSLF